MNFIVIVMQMVGEFRSACFKLLKYMSLSNRYFWFIM